MKLSLSLCVVSIVIGCANVPAPQARDAKDESRAPRLKRNASAGDRARRIQLSRSAMAADSLATLAQEKVQYLWTMLPQQADGTCSAASALAQCRADAQFSSAQFELELGQSEATYDEAKALSLYEASRGQAAECKTQEFACLVAEFDGFGGNSETRRDMAEALKSLELREQLVVETGVEGSLPCLDAGVRQYQSRIAQDYQQFSREPVLAAQAQLHRDFRDQYDAQVACLQSSGRSHRTANND
jgi:hypothetical protein